MQLGALAVKGTSPARSEWIKKWIFFIPKALSELLLAQHVLSLLCHRCCWRAGLSATGDSVTKDSDAQIPAAQTLGILTPEWAASPSSAWTWRYEWVSLGCLQGKGEEEASLGRDGSIPAQEAGRGQGMAEVPFALTTHGAWGICWDLLCITDISVQRHESHPS